jgi:hypothetical protein
MSGERYSVTGLVGTSAPHLKEYARNAGAEDRERAWILTPWDTWEPNPYYQGPPVRHPEDDGDEYD